MADITTIKKLRDETGFSITKCKEALEASGGDIEQAREALREKGSVAAQKKSDRDLSSGVVQSYIHTTHQIGAMVELLCETDFVARNEDFVALARDIAMHCAAFQPPYLSREHIPADVMETITTELREGIPNDKPDEVQEKILEGMVDAKMKEVVLLEQMFVKDDSRSILQLVEGAVQKFGERVEVGKFVVWVI